MVELEAAQQTPDRSTLVERVIHAIVYEHSINPSRKKEARAAIREVADWLRSEYPRREGYGTAWARLLDDHAGQ